MRHPEPDLNPPEFYEVPLEWDDLEDTDQQAFDREWLGDHAWEVYTALSQARRNPENAIALAGQWQQARDEFAEEWSGKHPEACRQHKQQEETDS